MTFRSFVEILGADLRRQLELEGATSLGARAQALLLTQGVWATVVYRSGQLAYGLRSQPLAIPAKLAYKVANKLVEMATGISLPASARIGKGLYVGHFGCIFVHPDLVIGENFSIGQGVTLGTRGQGHSGAPVIGDDVYVGAGAKVLGPVTIGDGAAVGANAVVISDVPPGAVAVGVPAEIRGRQRTKD